MGLSASKLKKNVILQTNFNNNNNNNNRCNKN